MPVRTSYDHGIPSWVDLASTDAERAKAFYGELFGWSFAPYAEDADGGYELAWLSDQPVAGLLQMPPDMLVSGMPSSWTTYVAVDDLAATVNKVPRAGGQVLARPTSVSDAGSMALIADPTGATLGLWQAAEHAGAGLVNEHGTLTWNEVQTPDPAAAAAFYETVLGWSSAVMDMDEAEKYTVFHLGDGASIAGAGAPTVPGVPPHWSTVLATDDVDATAACAADLGGTVLCPPFDIDGVGRLTVIADPTGAVFQALQPTPTD